MNGFGGHKEEDDLVFAPVGGDTGPSNIVWGKVTEDDRQVVISVPKLGVPQETLKVTLEGPDKAVLAYSTMKQVKLVDEKRGTVTLRGGGASITAGYPLPDQVTAKGATAVYKDGMLTVTFPKIKFPITDRYPVEIKVQ